MKLNLNKLLKTDKLPGSILIYAEEEYIPLIDFVTNHIKLKLFDIVIYKFNADRYFDLTIVEDIMQNTSLFNSINYIEISYKTKPFVEQQAKLSKLIEKLDAHNYLCVITGKLTQKDLASSWAKNIDKTGIIINLTANDLKTVIETKLSQSNLTISPKASNYLIELNQSNISSLLQELNKLSLLYLANTTIEIHHIQNQDNSEYNIYQLSKTCLAGDLNQSIKVFQQIYQALEDAILINWVLHENIKKLLKMKDLLKKNISINQAALEVKGWGDNINDIISANNRLAYTTLLEILDRLSNIDMSIKGVKADNVRQQLTSVILEFCKPQS